MRKPFNIAEWLASVPNWLKAGMGLIGVIAGFIVAFRQNWYLYSTVAVVLLLGYLLGISLYILLKRVPSRSKKKKWNYTFEKYRTWGIAGLGFAILSLAGLLVATPTRTIGKYALYGTPTPIPPPKVEAADVLIAEFDPKYATQPVDVAHRLEADLEDRLDSFGLGDVNVQVLAEPVSSEAEAQDAANDTGSKVVIWGWYDDKGIQVKVFLSGGNEAGKELAGTNEIPLGVVGEESTEISFIVRDVLPENVSFLSLFVIGHLEYLSNDYESGHRAFDAAMNNMPDTVALENEAILHFFEARQLDASGADLEDVICGYAASIRADPGFAEAYNNLGTVFSRHYVDGKLSVQLSQETRKCLKESGLATEDDINPGRLYERAYALAPDMTVAHYNKLIFQWRAVGGASVMNEEELMDIQKEDPSLVGTYMILGEIYDRQSKWEDAIAMYEAGLKVDPNNAIMHFNAGQGYLIEKDQAKAEKAFQNVLDLKVFEYEAYLAFANLHFEQGKPEDALDDLANLFAIGPLDDEAWDTARVEGRVLKAAILFDQGKTAEAIKLLEAPGAGGGETSNFEYLVLGLIYHMEGKDDKAAEMFTLSQNYGFTYSRALNIAYDKIFSDCYVYSDSFDNMTEWFMSDFFESTCLPLEPRARINKVFDIFRSYLSERRISSITFVEDLGLACPYVYVFDSSTGDWRFETTILYRIRDKEGVQARELSQFDGRLLIREEEPEVTHLNQLYVKAYMQDGSVFVLRPDVESLMARDDQVVIMNTGDEMLVTFEDIPSQGEVARWEVVASGYYTILR
mgnify:FL=1